MKKRSVYFLTVCAVALILSGCFYFKKENKVRKTPETDSSLSYMYIASEGLNVRKGPDASSDIVTVLYQNDKIITDKVSHGGWYKISSIDGNTEGYVNASFLSATSVNDKKDTAPATEAPSQKPAEPAAETQPETRSKVISDETKPAPSVETAVTTLPAPATSESGEPMHPTLTKRPKN